MPEFKKAVPELTRLLDVDQVAALLRVTSRSVYRFADGGRMPRPLKIGGSVRWDREVIEQWINAGCPATPNIGARQ